MTADDWGYKLGLLFMRDFSSNLHNILMDSDETEQTVTEFILELGF
jgi:hypothetical protein